MANNGCQYISIDGRPLSVGTGTGEAITKLFKLYVRAAASKAEIVQKIMDPFCCLQIKCPQGAYDVNIEPGKDDVLFADRDVLFGLLENLFIEQYGPLLDGQERSQAKQRALTKGQADESAGFELLLSRSRPEDSRQSQSSRMDWEETTIASPVSQRAAARPVSQLPEDAHVPVQQHGVSSDKRETRYINPWSISTINASFQTPQRQRNTPTSPEQPFRDTADMTQRRRPSHRPTCHSSAESPEFLSPPASTLPQGSPPSNRTTTRMARGSPTESNRSVNSYRRAARERDMERYGNGALDTWFQRTTGALLHQDSVESPVEQEENTPSLSTLAQQRFQSSPPGEGDIAATDPVLLETSTRVSDYENARTSDRETHAAMSRDDNLEEESMDSGRGFPVLEKWAASLHKDFHPASQTDLDWALDFERRKKEANQKYRTRPGAADNQVDASERSGSSPHRNRYLAAKAALNAAKPTATERVLRLAIPPSDPRAYLMRHQTDGQDNESTKNGSDIRRLQSSKLPFERIPEGHDIHNISLSLPASLSLMSIPSRLIPNESLTESGISTDAFFTTKRDSLVSFWNRRLATLIQQHYRKDDQSQTPEWQVDLTSIVARHTAQFNQA